MGEVITRVALSVGCLLSSVYFIRASWEDRRDGHRVASRIALATAAACALGCIAQYREACIESTTPPDPSSWRVVITEE
jgi:hypothetical protein